MVELHKRGLTTAVICSSAFITLGRKQAQVFGVPDLPLIEIPHALGSLSADKIPERADRVVPKWVQLIEEHVS